MGLLNTIWVLHCLFRCCSAESRFVRVQNYVLTYTEISHRFQDKFSLVYSDRCTDSDRYRFIFVVFFNGCWVCIAVLTLLTVLGGGDLCPALVVSKSVSTLMTYKHIQIHSVAENCFFDGKGESKKAWCLKIKERFSESVHQKERKKNVPQKHSKMVLKEEINCFL